MTIFISLYMLLGLTCFAVWFAKDRQEGIFRLSVILFLPVLGYLLFFYLWLKERSARGNNKEYLSCGDREDTINKITIKGFDPKMVLNLVPLEEALLLNDNSVKRKLLLDILKKDITKYPAILKTALGSEDSETSHYAAAGIVEIKRKLLKSVQEWSRKYETKKDEDTLIFYAHALKKYQGCGLLDETSNRKAKEAYQKVLKELLEFYSHEEEFFIDRINYEIEAGEFELAGLYCKKFMDAHKQGEMPYLMYLKLFYQSRDRNSFDDILKALEASNVSLSRNTWNIIKFWTEVYS